MSVKETNRYKKCKKEYQFRLYHEENINKTKLAKKYKLTLQALNNWIRPYECNDLTDYVDVPSIIAKNDIEIKSNSKYTQELVEDMYFYAKEILPNGELRFQTKEALRDKLGLSKSTFSKYLNKREFYEAYVKGRAEAEKLIKKLEYEKALDKVALGTKRITKRIEPVFRKGEIVGEKATIMEEDILPNVKALEMGFNKLAPGEYDKKPFVEKQSLPKDIDWDNLTEEEIERLAKGEFGGIKGGNK